MSTGRDEKGERFRPGDRFGDCVVCRLVGRGAMGSVYLVAAPDGAEYALKVVDPGRLSNAEDYRRRFVREAEFAMSIHHPNLVAVHDAGENPETGLCYILMDYLPGGSLSDVLSARGPLPIAEAVSVASQVALALETAHRRGVIHRDIKPDNILFTADGTPKLADLGVAKFGDDATATMMTAQGMIVDDGLPPNRRARRHLLAGRRTLRDADEQAPERGQHGDGPADEGRARRAAAGRAHDASGGLRGGRLRPLRDVRAASRGPSEDVRRRGGPARPGRFRQPPPGGRAGGPGGGGRRAARLGPAAKKNAADIFPATPIFRAFPK